MSRPTIIALIASALAAIIALVGVVARLSLLSVVGVLGLLASVATLAVIAGRRPIREAAPAAVAPAMRVPTVPAGSGAPAALAALATDLSGHRLAAISLWLQDPFTSTVRHVAATGEMRPETEPVSDTSDLLARCIELRTALLEPIARVGAERFVLTRFAVPLHGEDWQGVVAVDLIGERIDRAELVSVVGSHRMSLEAALDVHQAVERAHAAQSLVGAAAELFRMVDPKAVAEALLDRVMRAAHADTGSVLLMHEEDGRLRIVAAEGLPADVTASTRLAPGEGIAGWVYSTGKATVVEDLQRPDKTGRHGVRSSIAVPLADEDGVIGVVNVGSRRFEARQAQPLIEALEALCGIGVVALRNAQASRDQREVQFSTLRALALALETKDPHARGTTDRVHDLAIALGRFVGITGSDLESLRIASLLHDVGMADSVGAGLMSRRALSTVEWGLVKTHPKVAKDLLEQSPSLSGAVPIVFNHHERFDGSGYMTGVSGEEIPLGARVLSVADAYIAMTSRRPYRDALTRAEALAELKSESGTQFDPKVVEALERLAAEGMLDALSVGS